jgi:hypothetical protein
MYANAAAQQSCLHMSQQYLTCRPAGHQESPDRPARTAVLYWTAASSLRSAASLHALHTTFVSDAQRQAIGTLILGSRQRINTSTQAQRTLASIRKHMMDETEVKLSQEPTKRHLHRKMLARLLFISKVRRGSGRRTQVGLVV